VAVKEALLAGLSGVPSSSTPNKSNNSPTRNSPTRTDSDSQKISSVSKKSNPMNRKQVTAAAEAAYSGLLFVYMFFIYLFLARGVEFCIYFSRLLCLDYFIVGLFYYISSIYYLCGYFLYLCLIGWSTFHM
jgi:hypothetical protein